MIVVNSTLVLQQHKVGGEHFVVFLHMVSEDLQKNCIFCVFFVLMLDLLSLRLGLQKRYMNEAL